MVDEDKNKTTPAAELAAANAAEAHGRGLRARHGGRHSFGAMTTVQCRAAYDTESGCNANRQCTWCQAAAAGSACYSMADAQVLPSEMFQCAG